MNLFVELKLVLFEMNSTNLLKQLRILIIKRNQFSPLHFFRTRKFLGLDYFG